MTISPFEPATLDRLFELIRLSGVSGDEGPVADWLEAHIAETIPDTTVNRIGDNLIVLRGTPRTAVFAHTDTTGYTLGYKNTLIPVGGPDAHEGDKLRSGDLTGRVTLAKPDKKAGHRRPALRLHRVRDSDNKKAPPPPGTRWVYARRPRVEGEVVSSPYLDDRAGVWSALETLRQSPDIAVAFCTGEEQHGHGARVCADFLHREHQITQALIADTTWHTDDTPCGKGVVISLRDAFCPRQGLLDRVLALAAQSNIPHQREIQSAGSSDGGHILRSTVPLDWVFIGAPEKRPHTAREEATLADLQAMTNLLTLLVREL